MNAYDAMIKAAVHIEQNPHLYDFAFCRSPKGGETACMLGWLAHFMGTEKNGQAACHEMLGIHSVDFYMRTHEFYSAGSRLEYKNAVHILRGYAAKYLKPAEPETPNWLAIATATNAYRPAAVMP